MIGIIAVVISLLALLVNIVKTNKNQRKSFGDVVKSILIFLGAFGVLIFNFMVLYKNVNKQEAITRLDIVFITSQTMMIIFLIIAITFFTSVKLKKLSQVW